MSMFSVGLSGLNAAQNALNTTSNNISNVFTPGYNRELAQLGEGRVGGGVRVDSIERQFNTYVANQLNSAKTQSSALNTYNNQISQIDNLLADRAAGLSPLMQNFFSSLEAMASAPSDPAARQGVLGTANTLSSQFRSFDGYLQDMQSNINNQIKDEVTQINNTVEQIAGLNKEISLARARTGEAPNSLLNQRDKMVSDLNELMDLRLNIQDGKTYNISLPNGQPLVTGTNTFKLEAVASDADPQRIVVGYRDGGNNLKKLDESTIKGGALGGLMTFRSETLDKTQNQIGQLAVSLSVAFNEQHKEGVDLEGERGGDFFSVGTPRAIPSQRNSSSVDVVVTFDADNIGQLKATDYTIRFEGTDPVITRKDNGQTVAFDKDAWNNDRELKFGGVSVDFNGNPQAGDRFEIQPVRRAGNGMNVDITDIDKIAAGDAGFEGGDSSTLNSFKRTGNLNISGLETSPTAFSSSKQYQLTVDEDGKLTAVPSAPIRVNDTAFDADTEVLEEGNIVVIDGISFTMGALPDANATATLTVSQNIISATGDNRNALALQALQNNNKVVGGSASVSGAYASIVSDVGNRANITQVNLDARQGLTDQLRAVQQSESGVNLDEEAANLIRYQQYYMANARVIDTAGSIMDTILNLRS
ncbi:flagellar hook-associated protein FlgK [Halomonas aquamarina]|uniref:Flagellar hook-associated protein FlgK n=1 Tax=Vreelandella aquamarina TaxID=77097 RepID=A0ACC5VXP1_9GAMM|nr:flagellar hook-associated protein FlgK [Halomonas aquamarina]MBZ5488541.1 flagellar hook-associated protein FlgK [Halomonas aquamarina]